jgi:TonB family protein
MSRVLLFLLFIAGLNVNSQPRIKGGLEDFVIRNTVYPPYSLQNCIEGTVKVSFKLDSKGAVFYSAVISGIGTDLDDEALRLIRMSSGKWEVPAGYDPSVSLIVPINFKLSGYNCGNKNPAQIQQAISAYQSNEGLTNAVLNFYRNKNKGVYNKEEERKILALKKELGYDEEFLKQKIEDGKSKLKQNDKQGACEDFLFVKNMGSALADDLIKEYCNQR